MPFMRKKPKKQPEQLPEREREKDRRKEESNSQKKDKQDTSWVKILVVAAAVLLFIFWPSQESTDNKAEKVRETAATPSAITLPNLSSIFSSKVEKEGVAAREKTIFDLLYQILTFTAVSLLAVLLVVLFFGKDRWWMFVRTGQVVFVENLFGGGGYQAGAGLVFCPWPLRHFAHQASSGVFEVNIGKFRTQVPLRSFDIEGSGRVPLTADVTSVFRITDLVQLTLSARSFLGVEKRQAQRTGKEEDSKLIFSDVTKSRVLQEFLGRLLREAVTGAFSTATCHWSDVATLGELSARSVNRSIRRSDIRGLACVAVRVEDPSPDETVLSAQSRKAASITEGEGFSGERDAAGLTSDQTILREAVRGRALVDLIAAAFGQRLMQSGQSSKAEEEEEN